MDDNRLQDNYIVIPKGWRFEEYDAYGKELRMHVIFKNEYESRIYFTAKAWDLIENLCNWDNPRVFAKWDSGAATFALEPTYSQEGRKFVCNSELFEVYEDDGRHEYEKSPISQTWLYEWRCDDSIDVSIALRAFTKRYIKDDKGFSARGYWDPREQMMLFDLHNGLKVIKGGEKWWLND